MNVEGNIKLHQKFDKDMETLIQSLMVLIYIYLLFYFKSLQNYLDAYCKDRGLEETEIWNILTDVLMVRNSRVAILFPGLFSFI